MTVTSGFNHVATVTSDLDRLAEFYGKAFGAVVTLEVKARDDPSRTFASISVAVRR